MRFPDAGRICFEGAFANFHPHPPTEVDYRNGSRAPLPITAGEHDHTVPSAVASSNHRKYRDLAAVTEFHQFPAGPPADGRGRPAGGGRLHRRLGSRVLAATTVSAG
jgi:hypothetical protein